MKFVIISGTSIREVVERCDNAKSALERTLELIARRAPGVRVVDRAGNKLRLSALRQLAEEERGDAAAATSQRSVDPTLPIWFEQK
jgi:hypothetical protein